MSADIAGKNGVGREAILENETPPPGGNSLKKTIAVLIPAILAQAIGNVFLSMRMKEVGDSSLFALLPRAIESPSLWVGTALLIVSFILFAAALSWADLSFVMPAISSEVVVNVVFAKYFLSEDISLTRWAGILLISIGVLLVMRSARQKENQENQKISGSQNL